MIQQLVSQPTRRPPRSRAKPTTTVTCQGLRTSIYFVACSQRIKHPLPLRFSIQQDMIRVKWFNISFLLISTATMAINKQRTARHKLQLWPNPILLRQSWPSCPHVDRHQWWLAIYNNSRVMSPSLETSSQLRQNTCNTGITESSYHHPLKI